MPIYEYVCRDCNAHFEVIRPIKEADNPQHCKKCQSQHVDRMISVFVARSSSGQTIAGGGCSCGSCSGGSCASCRN